MATHNNFFNNMENSGVITGLPESSENIREYIDGMVGALIDMVENDIDNVDLFHAMNGLGIGGGGSVSLVGIFGSYPNVLPIHNSDGLHIGRAGLSQKHFLYVLNDSDLEYFANLPLGKLVYEFSIRGLQPPDFGYLKDEFLANVNNMPEEDRQAWIRLGCVGALGFQPLIQSLPDQPGTWDSSWLQYILDWGGENYNNYPWLDGYGDYKEKIIYDMTLAQQDGYYRFEWQNQLMGRTYTSIQLIYGEWEAQEPTICPTI